MTRNLYIDIDAFFSSLSYSYQLCLLFSCKSSAFLSNLILLILLYNSYLSLYDTAKACFIVFDQLLKVSHLTALTSDNLRMLFHLQTWWCLGGPFIPSWSSAVGFAVSWAPSPWVSSALSTVHCLRNTLFFETALTWFSFTCWNCWLYILPVTFIVLWLPWQVQFSSVFNPLSYPTGLYC